MRHANELTGFDLFVQYSKPKIRVGFVLEILVETADFSAILLFRFGAEGIKGRCFDG